MSETIEKITYYDSAQYALTKNDIWLRKFGEIWEVRIPIGFGASAQVKQYQKIEGEEKIRQIFDLVPENNFETDIANFGYAPFFTAEMSEVKKEEVQFIIEREEALEYLKNKKPDHYRALVEAEITFK